MLSLTSQQPTTRGVLGTFLNVPFEPQPRDARAVVLGAPFDCGQHPTRIGCRLGPQSIRTHSALVADAMADASFDLVRTLRLVDGGDAAVTPGLIEPSFVASENSVAAILASGAVPVTMGGDGAITLPQLRAVARRWPGLAVLHLDAHTDAYPIRGRGQYDNGNTFTHAAEERIVDIENSIHVGTRGAIDVDPIVAEARAMGYEVVPMEELRRRGLDSLLAHLRERLSGKPVYLCWDMDVFDPSAAPGVANPVWGGLSAAEGLTVLRGLAGLDIVAIDVNTVSPPHDPAGMTAFLAGQVMVEAMAGIARRWLNR
jgi:agmatinase